ncbi:MAG: N-acetyltransferase family protein [Bacillota bacterium]
MKSFETVKNLKPLIRPAETKDYPFLQQMLYEAIFIPEGETKPPLSILDAPEINKYVRGWKKTDDVGFIAEIEGEDAGAAWTRLFENTEAGGYGFVDNGTPELALAIYEKYRGMGVGTALMQALTEELKMLGYKKLSLSVDKANRAVNLYKRLEFKVIKEQETDFLMVKDL